MQLERFLSLKSFCYIHHTHTQTKVELTEFWHES